MNINCVWRFSSTMLPWKLWRDCVCVCAHMCMCVCVYYMQMTVACTCVRWRPIENIKYLPPSFFSLYLSDLRQEQSLNWCLSVSPRYQPVNSWDLPVSVTRVAAIANMKLGVCFLCACWRLKLRSSYLQKNHFKPLNHHFHFWKFLNHEWYVKSCAVHSQLR